MISGEVRIIPFSGKPLEYDFSKSARTVFPAPERGFLIGPENFALEPIVRWAVEGRLPRDRQPILFYGPVGSGRTHLLRGILEAWRKNQPREAIRRRSYYLPAADFARLLSDAIDTRTTDDFRRRYRKARLLVVDDLEQIVDKPWALEELQHTMDVLAVEEGLTVLSSSFSPGRENEGKKGFSERFRARLLGGTNCPILPPGPSVRKRFFRELASAFRVSVPSSTLDAVAGSLALSIPELYGWFAQMYFEAEASKTTIDANYVKSCLQKPYNTKKPGLAEIVRRTAKHFALKPTDLRGPLRNKTVALARSIAVFLAREHTGLPLKDIGKYFGGRDPSTVRHLVERIQKELPEDETLRDHLARIDLKSTGGG